QTVLAKAMATNDISTEKAAKKDILESRARKVQQVLANPEYRKYWEAYPFNSGYFMCVKLKGIDADAYRKHLLEKYGVGVIADGERDI
ncbi:hypothetical protein NL529_29890, partial [Klebsiella pneumoniae]|nr:hypothetical protein [Klebsiella pneumoniae]